MPKQYPTFQVGDHAVDRTEGTPHRAKIVGVLRRKNRYMVKIRGIKVPLAAHTRDLTKI